jgi:hypothetical protein
VFNTPPISAYYYIQSTEIIQLHLKISSLDGKYTLS